MKNVFSILILLFFLSSCCNKSDNPYLSLYTKAGIITIELYPDQAPVTVNNFLSYVKNHAFDSALFYRTVTMQNQPNNKIKIEVIQGGLEFNNSHEELLPIKHENTQQTGLKHLDGTISMARLDTGTATTEFFICINDQPELDYGSKRNPDGQGFAAFGKVTEGMDVVRKIQHLPDTGQFLVEPVVIDSIRVLRD